MVPPMSVLSFSSRVSILIVSLALAVGGCGGSTHSQDESTSGGEHAHAGHEHGEVHHGEHHEHGVQHGHDEHGEHHEQGEHHHEHGGQHEHGEDHHGDLPAPLAALHDVLAPVWHMDEGPERQAAACESAADFVTLSGDAGQGYASGAALSEAAVALQGECGANAEGVASAFDAFHTRFHEVMEQSREAE